MIWIAYLVAAAFPALALRSWRRVRLLKNTPSSKARGVFIGLVEVVGTAETDNPLTGALSGAQAAAYRFRVEESWSKEVVEKKRASDGTRKKETRTERGWTEVGGEDHMVPFYLTDDTGAVQVVPRGGRLQLDRTFDEVVRSDNALYTRFAPQEPIEHSDGERRLVEEAIPLHAPVYVIGRASERSDMVAPTIGVGEDGEPFVVSTRSEEVVTGGHTTAMVILLVLGIGLTTLFWFLARPSAAWPFAVYAGVLALGWLISVYNELLALRRRVLHAQSLIDIQLKRRVDLLPSLISVVEALSGHERDLQTTLAELRAQAQKDSVGAGVAGTAPGLLAVAEAYPELLAMDGYAELSRNLVDIENRIALARDYFNAVATHYNNRVSTVPEVAIATVAGVKPRPLFEADGFERASVVIDLDSDEADGHPTG